METYSRIDTHQHIAPPAYAKWIEEKGVNAGGKGIPKWSVEDALSIMDTNRIDRAILSVSTPGVHLGEDMEARFMAREVNEYAATVVGSHPDRFGFFATVPLPDIDGTLSEVAYAYDALHADGVVLLSNANGKYLGDPAFDPVMEELNRRKAVVFIHPTALPAPELPGIPPYVADFLLETCRAAINIAKSGALERYPDLKIILSHGGGFIPYASARIALACSPNGQPGNGIDRLRRFYYDTALTSSPYSLPSLLAFADPTHIVFGSDWPFAPKDRATGFTEALDIFPLNDNQRAAINRINAEAMFMAANNR